MENSETGRMTASCKPNLGTCESSGRKRLLVWTALAILVGLRLFLSGDRDIAALNSPYDEYWFVHSAARMIWGGGYSQLAFAHLPIYSIWLALLNVVGLPARLGIDLAWIVATAYAGYGIYRFTGKKWVGLGFWIVSMFHPLLIVLFDRALSETLLTVLMAMLVGAGLEIWNTRDITTTRRGRVSTWVFALAFALAFHVRKEGALLLAPIAVFAVCSYFRRESWWPARIRLGLGVRLVAAPLIAALVLGCALASINFLRWGLAVRYELNAPGYVAAMAALNRIDAGRGPLYVTVTRKARELAYEQSPTFRELKPFFEGEQGRSLAEHSAQFTGQQGEIGNGWFYWALRDAGAVAGWHSSALNADQKYAAIATELNEAFRSGRLKAYSSMAPAFLDPDFSKWVGRVPASIVATFGLVLETNPESVRPMPENATPKQFAEFTEIVGRRNPLPEVSVRGWIIVPEGSAIGLGTAGRAPDSWLPLNGPARPDVPGGLPFTLHSSGPDLPTTLQVKTADGKMSEVGIVALREGAMGKTAGEGGATFGVDELSAGARPTRIERWLSYLAKRPLGANWLAHFAQLYKWLVYMLLVVSAVAVLKVVSGSKGRLPLAAIWGLGMAVVVPRAILFGVLDASSWSGVQARYMAPMLPVALCMAVIAAWIVFQREEGFTGSAITAEVERLDSRS